MYNGRHVSVSPPTHGGDRRSTISEPSSSSSRREQTWQKRTKRSSFTAPPGAPIAKEILDRDTDETKVWHPDGVFVFIGVSPNSDFLPREIERDRRGFVTTDKAMQTSLKGIFAAGDVHA
ncbi:MAG TPA: hypothetical protein ENN19_01515 [Chloroflexi bacterium]|nr:hypothetical protein [Chloroflexota bacterium]